MNSVTLPSNWAMTPLGEAAENLDGTRVPLKLSDRENRHGDYPYYGASGIIDYIDSFHFDGEYLLVAEDGANLLARSTPIAFLANGKFWVNNHAHVLGYNGKACLRFLQRYLCSIDISRFVTGSAQPKLTKKNLDAIEIPLPPLPEQKRIADILDKADAIRRKRQEAKDLAGIFQQGLFCEMFGDPITNGTNWPVRTFGDLATNEDGRRRPVKASDRKDVQGVYPYYGASGIIDYVDSFLFDETALLIGEDGANLLARSTPIAFLATGKYWVNNHAHVVTPNGNATLLYLATHLNMRNIQDFVTGSAQPKLNQANLNKIPIPCPPMSMQEEFDRRVNNFDLIRGKQTVADKDAEDVFNSLVQRAFRGEL